MLAKIRDFVLGSRPVMRVSPYDYVAGPRDLGIGVDNLAAVQPGLPMAATQYSRGRNIRRNMTLLSGGFADTLPSYPATDLRANGVYLSGDIALASLVEFESVRSEK